MTTRLNRRLTPLELEMRRHRAALEAARRRGDDDSDSLRASRGILLGMAVSMSLWLILAVAVWVALR